jgi:hypothetical protein
MEFRRALALPALVLTLSGCWFVETAANSTGMGTPAKVVAAKTPPDLLIARDGTTCRVPERRFDQIRVGQTVTCVWSSRDVLHRVSVPSRSPPTTS